MAGVFDRFGIMVQVVDNNGPGLRRLRLEGALEVSESGPFDG